jgi:RNA recognition motif-containing protein
MNQKRLYIGNLPYRATEKDLRILFRRYAPIHSIHFVYHRETGRPRGFAFIDLDESMADKAMILNNMMFGGRNLRISLANGVTPHVIGGGDLTPVLNVLNQSVDYDSNNLSQYSCLELREKCPYCNQYVTSRSIKVS